MRLWEGVGGFGSILGVGMSRRGVGRGGKGWF